MLGKEDLVEGQYYYATERSYFCLFQYNRLGNDCCANEIRILTTKFITNMSGDRVGMKEQSFCIHYHRDRSFRLATAEQIAWLDFCVKEKQFYSLDDYKLENGVKNIYEIF